jgi:ribulose-5-phosphate 4-epimerase/fuculose-1-phosphate aldolase
MLETCSDLMEKAYDRNWITVRDGNISLRFADRDHFWITPSGIRKPDLQPNMWKKLSIETQDDGSPIELDYTDISANLRPSGEFPLHYGLQKNIADWETRVVVHLHPTYTVAAMHRGLELHRLVDEFPELGRYSRVAPSTPIVPPISEELGKFCHKNLNLKTDGTMGFDIIGIKGHGVVAIDTTPWRAFEHIERLEHICKIVLVSGV